MLSKRHHPVTVQCTIFTLLLYSTPLPHMFFHAPSLSIPHHAHKSHSRRSRHSLHPKISRHTPVPRRWAPNVLVSRTCHTRAPPSVPPHLHTQGNVAPFSTFLAYLHFPSCLVLPCPCCPLLASTARQRIHPWLGGTELPYRRVGIGDFENLGDRCDANCPGYASDLILHHLVRC